MMADRELDDISGRCAADVQALVRFYRQMRARLSLIHDVADERLRQGDEGDWHTIEAESRAE